MAVTTKEGKGEIICGRFGPWLPAQTDWEDAAEKVRIYRGHQKRDPTGSRTIARKLGWKCQGDDLFYNDPHRAWNEAWRCQVEEPLLHIDFNSLYPHIATGGSRLGLRDQKFPNPKKLRLLGPKDAAECTGIWIARLHLKPNETTNWFAAHHYLRYGNGRRTAPFLWPKNRNIKTIVHSEDIEAMAPWIETEVIWGVGCRREELIRHPLENQIQRCLEERELAKKAGDAELAETKKMEANSLCTTRATAWGANPEGFQKIYGGGSPAGRKPSPCSTQCLQTTIVARGRASLLRLAAFVQERGEEVCQCHTDGLWTTNRDALEEKLEGSGWQIDNRPGGVKIEKATRGLFLGSSLWWTVASDGSLLHAGTAKDQPTNLVIPLETGEYHLTNHSQSNKLLRKTNGALRWRRLPPQEATRTEKRHRRMFETYMRVFQRFEQSLGGPQLTFHLKKEKFDMGEKNSKTEICNGQAR